MVADIQLKFSKLAVEPLKIIKSAVTQGKCSSFEVEKDYFILEKRCSRQSRSDKTESGYGSQFFEHISFIEKSQEPKLSENSKKLPTSKSTSDLKSASADSVRVIYKGDVDGKVGKKMMKSKSLSCGVTLKNIDVENLEGKYLFNCKSSISDKAFLEHCKTFYFNVNLRTILDFQLGAFLMKINATEIIVLSHSQIFIESIRAIIKNKLFICSMFTT